MRVLIAVTALVLLGLAQAFPSNVQPPRTPIPKRTVRKGPLKLTERVLMPMAISARRLYTGFASANKGPELQERSIAETKDGSKSPFPEERSVRESLLSAYPPFD
uniref:Uncharacterized protein n=1 Tax=Rhipicephalus appendiculatus TaxID=34631 RepID=A0A131YDJ1_RHIAP